MSAQWEVPGIKMASSDTVWFVRTLNACQGSIDPRMENKTLQKEVIYQREVDKGKLTAVASFEKLRFRA